MSFLLYPRAFFFSFSSESVLRFSVSLNVSSPWRFWKRSMACECRKELCTLESIESNLKHISLVIYQILGEIEFSQNDAVEKGPVVPALRKYLEKRSLLILEYFFLFNSLHLIVMHFNVPPSNL